MKYARHFEEQYVALSQGESGRGMSNIMKTSLCDIALYFTIIANTYVRTSHCNDGNNLSTENRRPRWSCVCWQLAESNNTSKVAEMTSLCLRSEYAPLELLFALQSPPSNLPTKNVAGISSTRRPQSSLLTRLNYPGRLHYVITMRPSSRLLATIANPAARTPLRSQPMNLLPPIPLYRRLFRAHRKHLDPESRVLGDAYIRAEFRAHRDVENPVHIVCLSRWKPDQNLLAVFVPMSK